MSVAAVPKVRLTREQLEKVIEISPFTKWVGTRVTAFSNGQVGVEIDIRPEMAQHHGFAHGALVGYMADTACAWAAASAVGDVVTSEYKLNLLAPAVGEKLRATGSVVKAGARQVVTRADVYAVRDGVEKIVATALATIARV
ncbi:MAG TPA: PaaI family thioesterase [Ferrovibrio sp.]|uniref:PaaI family thioesterase n=1 Tax=Ferrovibrio sp. TaxID=1917215 RepID=UPI002B4B7485|nr:PaaI family thioesterase [Ferrovibrio sp.]HLT79182.1 PaaI family thioesterase [Ferrovibrio sp.]